MSETVLVEAVRDAICPSYDCEATLDEPCLGHLGQAEAVVSVVASWLREQAQPKFVAQSHAVREALSNRRMIIEALADRIERDDP